MHALLKCDEMELFSFMIVYSNREKIALKRLYKYCYEKESKGPVKMQLVTGGVVSLTICHHTATAELFVLPNMNRNYLIPLITKKM